MRVSPSKSLYYIEGKDFEYKLFLIPTKTYGYYFFFIEMELKMLQLLLWKKNFKVRDFIKEIFDDYDYNNLKKAN